MWKRRIMVSSNRWETMFNNINSEQKTDNSTPNGHSIFQLFEILVRHEKANEMVVEKVLLTLKEEIGKLDGDGNFKINLTTTVAGSVLFSVVKCLPDLGMPKEVQWIIIDSIIQRLLDIKKG